MINMMHVFLAAALGGSVIAGLTTQFWSAGWSAVLGYICCFAVVMAILNKVQPFKNHVDSVLDDHYEKEHENMTDKEKARHVVQTLVLLFLVPIYLTYKIASDMEVVIQLELAAVSGTLAGFLIFVTTIFLLKDKL